MSWRSVAIQALVTAILWGAGMVLFFGWPRETIAVPLVIFASLMFAILGTVKVVRDRRK